MKNLQEELETLYQQKQELEKKIEFLEKKIQNSEENSIVLSDAIYINTTKLSKKLIQELEKLATFENPQIKILQNLRKPIYNTPRFIKSFEISSSEIILPRGLMRKVIELFTEHQLKTTYLDKRVCQKVVFAPIEFVLREEQQMAMKQILKKDFSIFVAPPGFGKTLIGAKAIESRQVNTLVIVNKNMLLEQWIERFVNYFGYKKNEIGYLGKGKNTLNFQLDVATMQSLKNDSEIIQKYSFVIVDECHHIPAITFEKIIKEFQGKYILGLSATPNRKDGMEPLIFQQLGSISYEIKSKKVTTNRLEIVETDFISQAENFGDFLNQLINSEQRNHLIIEQIIKYSQRKILVLSDRIEHIENLELLLKSRKINFITIHGSLNKNEQKENMEKIHKCNLILATTSYFGEGIDFPHLDTIILATPISYYGRVVQYLGRIGRGGDDCLAIDILDILNPFALSSFKKRKEGYKQLHYMKSK